MVNDFLFELGCEELPSGAVKALGEALATFVRDSLNKLEISYSSLKYFATPRRIALLINGLPEEQPAQQSVRRGPAIAAAYDSQGQATPALKGFAKSCGVAISELTVSKTDKGEWLVYEQLLSGLKMRDCLPAMMKQALQALPIAKMMRWGKGEYEFARPVHWIIMLLGNDLLPCELFGLQTQRHTYGHRFLAPQALAINNPLQYESLLHEAYVVADFATRRELIIEQIKTLAKTYEATPLMPMALLDEVTSIVEWPEALLANFEPAFLEVPEEALIASMQAHQKCFALNDHQGKLLPHFITVTNLRSKKPEQVIHGNEKVMRARLSDAAFFFYQDKKQPLSHHIAATKNVTFQIKLGSLFDKTTRMKRLMAYLSKPLGLNAHQAERVAELSKCDLMTGMVGEFPELQGLMGYYYAKQDGEDLSIANALYEHYLPRFAGDDLPKESMGLALSLADRLDTLVGIFAIDQKPSGDKDPFKLRRHALAVVRLLMMMPAKLTLSSLITEALSAYAPLFEHDNAHVAELQAFILERLPSFYQSQAISQDVVNAVKVCQSDCLYDFDHRVKALSHFITLPEAASLSAACKRVNNLLQQVNGTPAEIEEMLLQEAAEKQLFETVKSMEQVILPLYEKNDYTLILTQLASLREPVDAFFEGIMVMVDDKAVKMNRLALLSRLQRLLMGTADISLLQLNAVVSL